MELVLLAILLTSCQRDSTFQGDWRDLHRGSENGKWGFVDREGKWAIPPLFLYVSPFHEGLAWAAKNKRSGYGYIDKTGRWAFPRTFAFADHFSEGLAGVKVKEGWGFIDIQGVVVIPPVFQEVQSFSDGLAAVAVGTGNDLRWGFIDKEGSYVIEPKYPGSPSFFYRRTFFSSGVAVVQMSFDRFDVINRQGEIINSVAASRVNGFFDGLALVELRMKNQCDGSTLYRYIDSRGNFAFDESFCNARDFSEDLAAVSVDNKKFGYIDRTGRFVISPQYYVAKQFSEGLAAVSIDSHESWNTYIDKNGMHVIPKIGSARADRFVNGMAAVDLYTPNGYLAAGARWGYIDKTGKVLCTFGRGKENENHAH